MYGWVVSAESQVGKKEEKREGEREREKKAGKKWILEKGQCNEKKS